MKGVKPDLSGEKLMQNVTPGPCKIQHPKSHTSREENGNMNFLTVGIVSPVKMPLRSTHHMPLIPVGACFLLSPLSSDFVLVV